MNRELAKNMFTKRLAETLESGYVLSMQDIKREAPNYGFAPNSAYSFFALVHFALSKHEKDGNFIQADENSPWIPVVETEYKHRRLIYSGNFQIEETDITQVQQRIDIDGRRAGQLRIQRLKSEAK